MLIRWPYMAEEGANDGNGGTATATAPAPATTPAPAPTPEIVPGEGSHSTIPPARLPDGRFGVKQYDALDYRGSLSEEIRGNPKYTKTLDVYPDINHFVRDAQAWREELGRRPSRFPTADSTPEEWQSFWKHVPGYPEKPQGYQDMVKLPELPKYGENETPRAWDERDLQTLYETAFAEGMTAKQTQAILDLYARREASAKNFYEAQLAEVAMHQQRERYTRFGASTQTEEKKATAFFQRLTQDTELGQRVKDLLDKAQLDDGRKVMNEPDVVQFLSLALDRWVEPGIPGLETSINPIPTAAERDIKLNELAAIALDERQSPERRREAVNEQMRIHASSQRHGR